jgi:hypothetical protein
LLLQAPGSSAPPLEKSATKHSGKVSNSNWCAQISGAETISEEIEIVGSKEAEHWNREIQR